MRIALKIEKLRLVLFAKRQLEAAVAQRDHRCDRSLGRIFHRDGFPFAPAGRYVDQALAVRPAENISEIDTHKFGKGGQDVER